MYVDMELLRDTSRKYMSAANITYSCVYIMMMMVAADVSQAQGSLVSCSQTFFLTRAKGALKRVWSGTL